MTAEPITLEGSHVRLEPLTLDHVSALARISSAPEVWNLTSASLATEHEVLEYVRLALRMQAEGTSVPFVTVEKRSGLPVGSTRFANMSAEHKRVEIGWTWIAPEWQRTVVNTEAKYLMLQHAFSTWECNRVELKTSMRNYKSRRAIARIGAKEEGVLRHHMVNLDGTLRDTVYFSIIRPEWPEVKLGLELKLGR